MTIFDYVDLCINFSENRMFFDMTLEERKEFDKTLKKVQKILSDGYVYGQDSYSFKHLKKYIKLLSELSGIKVSL
jgi:FMN-dependent NADH-azoreductase